MTQKNRDIDTAVTEARVSCTYQMVSDRILQLKNKVGAFYHKYDLETAAQCDSERRMMTSAETLSYAVAQLVKSMQTAAESIQTSYRQGKISLPEMSKKITQIDG